MDKKTMSKMIEIVDSQSSQIEDLFETIKILHNKIEKLENRVKELETKDEPIDRIPVLHQFPRTWSGEKVIKDMVKSLSDNKRFTVEYLSELSGLDIEEVIQLKVEREKENNEVKQRRKQKDNERND